MIWRRCLRARAYNFGQRIREARDGKTPTKRCEKSAHGNSIRAAC